MEALLSSENWGSPVGIGLFVLFSCVGVGVLFWGISRLAESNKKD